MAEQKSVLRESAGPHHLLNDPFSPYRPPRGRSAQPRLNPHKRTDLSRLDNQNRDPNAQPRKDRHKQIDPYRPPRGRSAWFRQSLHKWIDQYHPDDKQRDPSAQPQ